MTALPFFVDQDFAAYEDARQRDPEYNAFRLVVRRKLETHGKAAKACLKKERGLDLAIRTSLNHPHATNRNRVSSQIAYLSRAPKDKKALGAIVGKALSKDVDTHYIQTTLNIVIDAGGFEQSLRIHSQAWWDGLNLKKRVADEAGLDLFGDLVNSLPQGFVLLMDSWRKEYLPGSIGPQDLQRYFASYTPGEHWFNLRRRIPKGLAIDIGERIGDFVEEGMLALAHVYRFVCWSPENNFLFGDDGRMHD